MKKVLNVVKYLLLYLFIFLSYLIIFSANWANITYGNLSVDEIIFQLRTPMVGTSRVILMSYLKEALIPVIIVFLLTLFLLIYYKKALKGYNFVFEMQYKGRKKSKKVSKSINSCYLPLLFVVALSLFSIYFTFKKVAIYQYLKAINTSSNFIEENYVDPKEVELTFPDEKKNLIYIFVESLESTYFSKEYGGAFEENYMQDLVELTKENVNFSNTDKFGGAYEVTGTTWTSAAMVSHTSGLPLKSFGGYLSETQIDDLLKGAYSIGKILEEQGYNQELLIGSFASFGNRNVYFQKHGNYKIVDLQYARDAGWVDEDYYVWWGYEDSKLFEFAKNELEELADSDEPFNLTMLTANTHFPDGYLEDDCPTEFDSNLKNVVSCTSTQLANFIKWIQKQDFYENTTIVIAGDHLSMEPDFFKDVESNGYKRKIYNLFINSSVKTKQTKNREFTTIDMFPTTLAALGVKIESDKLALGVNLFSDEKTLVEKYSFEYVNEEFAKKSKFYEKNFLYKK